MSTEGTEDEDHPQQEQTSSNPQGTTPQTPNDAIRDALRLPPDE